MKVAKIVFLFMLVGGFLWGCYSLLFAAAQDFRTTALAANETFIAETSGGFPALYVLAIIAVALGVLVWAFRR